MHYTLRDGLPSMTVYCIMQDSEGFLWFGTDNGLARFDGNQFKVFTMRDGLPDPEVLTLFEDNQQRLWISCFQKQPCYMENGVIFSAENDSLLNQIEMSSGTYTFHEDSDQSIWIAGDAQNFCRWRKEELTCFPNPPGIGALRDIFSIDDRRLGMSIWAFADITDPYSNDSIMVVPRNYTSIRGASYAVRGQMIVYNYLYEIILMHYQDGELTILDIVDMGIPGNLTFDRSGNIWISSTGKGAYCFSIQDNKLVFRERYFKNNQIARIYEDKDGTYWFATMNEGLYALKTGAPISYSSKSSPVFRSNYFPYIDKLSDGQIIAGDDKGNIYLKNSQGWVRHEIANQDGFNKVRQVLPRNESSFYVISDDGLFSENGDHVTLFDKNKARRLSIGALKVGLYEQGISWLGGSSGLVNWHRSAKDVKIFLSERISALGVDLHGNVWAGGLNGILSEKDGFQFKWGERFPAVGGRIISLKPAGQNAMWVASPEYGLVKAFVKDGAVTGTMVVNDQIGNPILDIQSIFVAEDQAVWLATNSGVYAIDRESKVRQFTSNDGLTSNDVNDILLDADTLWAATSSGLSKITLNNREEEGDFPTFISGVRYLLNNQPFEVDLVPVVTRTKELVLPAGTSMLEIELSGLHYKSRGNLQYEFITGEKLLPVQWLTWNNIINTLAQKITNKCDTVIVPNHNRNLGVNIPPGRHLIKVTAVLNSGTMSQSPDEYIFTIRPFWYETIWFSMVLAGLTGFLGWWFYRQQTKMRRFQRVASELQLQAIKAQINPHFIGNSINAIQQFFYPPDPMRASQYIATFTSLLRRTMHFSEIPFITLEQELEFITDYLDLIALRFSDRFEYQLVKAAGIDPKTPFPAMIVQPILENATIHGLALEGVSKLQVELVLHQTLLTCTITDNGVGIDQSRARKKRKKRISKGIKLLNKKIEVLNKMHDIDLSIIYLDLSSIKKGEQGTKVTISFTPNKIDGKLVFEHLNHL
ncbi:MAG: two-component regulator propeller domain-containing protein [Bacteroidota bacterium]